MHGRSASKRDIVAFAFVFSSNAESNFPNNNLIRYADRVKDRIVMNASNTSDGMLARSFAFSGVMALSI